MTNEYVTDSNGKFLPIVHDGKCRKPYIREIERIFGFEDHYTGTRDFSKTERLKLLGLSWSVPCVEAILRVLRKKFLVDIN